MRAQIPTGAAVGRAKTRVGATGTGLAKAFVEARGRLNFTRTAGRGCAMRTDAELKRDVLEELRRDKKLRIEELDVQVEGRVVTLTGQAETPGQCWRAQQVARYVAGLARVSNCIVVRPH